MAKIVLDTVQGGYDLSVINDNFDKIEAEFQNEVLYRNNPVGEPNSMEQSIDMNGHTIYNAASISTQSLSINGQLVVANETFVTPLPDPVGQTDKVLASDGASPYWSLGDPAIANNTDIAKGDALIGVKSSKAGSVTRTQHSKNEELRSVKDFGAVGDGVVDDTAALQAALDSNELCYMPPGKYRITSELIHDPDTNRNGGFIGLVNPTRYPYADQGAGTPTWNGLQEASIVYDGSSYPIIDTTSGTSVSLLAGVRGFNIATGLSPVIGQPVTMYRTSDPDASRMHGLLVSYDSGTGAATADMTNVIGTGTFTDWTVVLFDNHTVIRASAEAVGVEPAALYGKTIWGMQFANILLDGNNKAGFGLYCARVQDLQLDHVRARGATMAGFSINGTYSGSAKRCRAYLNYGRGFEIGSAADLWCWTVQDKANAFYVYDLHTENNGYDSRFRETSKILREVGCGLYYRPHRGLRIDGLVSENNFGANIVFKPNGNGNSIAGVYTERGNLAAPGGVGTDAISLGYSTQQWGMIFVGLPATIGPTHNVIDSGVFAGDHVWLTGAEPSVGRLEGGVKFSDIGLCSGLKADWGNYRLVNCTQEMESALTGTVSNSPINAPGGIRFGYNKTHLKIFEEGTWTPSLVGATVAGTGWTYSVQNGSYQRIGNRVYFNGRVTLTAVSGDATGQIQVAGLPYAAGASNIAQSAVVVASVTNFTTAVVSVGGAIVLNDSKFGLQRRAAAAVSFSSVVLADLSATTSITFSGSYPVS